MNYADGATAIADVTFLAKTKIGLAKVCQDIMTEAADTANHALRVAHAEACLGNLAEAAAMFAVIIVTNPVIVDINAADQNIYDCIVVAFNTAAGVHN